MKTLQEIIENAVVAAVDSCGGNQSVAADMLDISRTTLRKYLTQHAERQERDNLKRQRRAA